jgi:hypothetical protein
MKKKGFDIDWPEAVTETRPGGYGMVYRRYAGVYDRSVAARWGYHPPDYVANDEYFANLPPIDEAELEAMGGTYEEREVAAATTGYRAGCYGESDAYLLAGTVSYTSVDGHARAEAVRVLLGEGSSHYLVDPRVLAAQAAWSACMAKGGYDLANPLADKPLDLISVDSPVPWASEIEMALWDVDCQAESGVVEVSFEVESEFQRGVIDRDAEVFARVLVDNELIVRHAAEAVAGR